MFKSINLFVLFSCFNFTNLCQNSNQIDYQNFFLGSYKYRTGNTKSAQDSFDNFFKLNKNPSKQALKEYLHFLFDTKQHNHFESVLNSNESMFNDEKT